MDADQGEAVRKVRACCSGARSSRVRGRAGASSRTTLAVMALGTCLIVIADARISCPRLPSARLLIWYGHRLNLRRSPSKRRVLRRERDADSARTPQLSPSGGTAASFALSSASNDPLSVNPLRRLISQIALVKVSLVAAIPDARHRSFRSKTQDVASGVIGAESNRAKRGSGEPEPCSMGSGAATKRQRRETSSRLATHSRIRMPFGSQCFICPGRTSVETPSTNAASHSV